MERFSLDRSCSSDSSSKACVVHVILSITVTWREVDESTPKILFFIQQKKKTRDIILVLQELTSEL